MSERCTNTVQQQQTVTINCAGRPSVGIGADGAIGDGQIKTATSVLGLLPQARHTRVGIGCGPGRTCGTTLDMALAKN